MAAQVESRQEVAPKSAPLKMAAVLVIGVVLLVLANLWVRQAALISIGAQVAMAVPPIPALAALLLLLAAYPLVRRLRVSRREIIGVYCFLTLAVALTSGGAMRFFLHSIPTLHYFAAPENNLGELHGMIPGWMGPTDEAVVRTYFEGSDGAGVPWEAWVGPLSLWMVFFVALFGLLIALAALFHPEWEQSEHLNYPLAELPLRLVEHSEGTLKIWTDRGFWIGFTLACLYNLLNILNAYNPGLSALGTDQSLDPLLSEHPLSALRPMRISYRPEILGFGYLMPTEIALSTVFFYFVYMKGISLGAALGGVDNAQLPYENEQAAGAYIALVALLVYRARHRILEVFGGLRRRSEGRWVLPAAIIVCSLVIVVFLTAAGMSPVVWAPYFALVLIYGVGYARLRAESGYPRMWGRPLGGEQNLLINCLGTARLAPGGNMRSLTLMASMHYMTRGYMAQLMAYPTEALKIGDDAGITRRRMIVLMLAAVLLGTVVSWVMHLNAFYEYGANILEGGTTSGGFRVSLMRQSYEAAASWTQSHVPPRRSEAIASLAGFAMVLGLAGLRRAFLRFPLHPLGLILALTGGGYTGWAMLLLVSLIKMSVLKVAGMGAYRALVPAFIGVAVGHYFAAGLVWSLLASFGGQFFSDRYQLWF
ncbi:MAG: DUF6785 family protein [Armatimonadota bacterium]|jgi:hypothetical protein